MMLYIHLPFCRQKCKYCAFCSGAFPYEIQERYVDKVVDALKYYVDGKTVQTIYIGGGTPSALPLPLWKKLLTTLGELVNVTSLREVTVECNPESTDEALLNLLKEGGVNRISFGVQSLDDNELSAIGRLHNAKTALSAIRLAQKVGFQNISADLIYGLPFQSVESFENSLQTLLACGITHLSCYNLQLEEGTPLFSEQSSLHFPNEDEQMEMYDVLCGATEKAGFIHYEISNFCKEGFEAVHNSGYWTGEDYIGIGAAAHSKMGNVRGSFCENVLAFIDKKDFSFDERTFLSDKDIKEETIMLGLRTRHGAPLSLLDGNKVEYFISLGLGEVRESHFILNNKGLMLSNSIIAELI